MNTTVITSVEAVVDAAREQELLDGYRQMTARAWPDGLLRAELLRGREGRWRLQSTWRDMQAILTLRASGVRPAALDLLESVGAKHEHAVFTVEQSYDGLPK